MRTWLFALFVGITFTLFSASSLAQDRVTFGDDAFVRAGEHVSGVVTMGGDAAVAGVVDTDVVTMGGDVVLERGGVVHGGLVTMGGDVIMRDGSLVEGEIVTMGGDLVREGSAEVRGGIVGAGERDYDEVVSVPRHPLASLWEDIASGLVAFGLVFLLGVLLRSLVPDRFGALQVAIIREPARSAALGFAGMGVAIGGVIALCITVIGIPLALAIILALPIVVCVGLAASASVIGAALPIEKLRDRPIAQIAAGATVLFIASLVPLADLVFLGLAAIVGVGALVMTRFDAVPPLPRADGPYRTSFA